MTWKDKANEIIDDSVNRLKYWIRTDNLGSAISQVSELHKALDQLKSDSKTPLKVRQTESMKLKQLMKKDEGR